MTTEFFHLKNGSINLETVERVIYMLGTKGELIAEITLLTDADPLHVFGEDAERLQIVTGWHAEAKVEGWEVKEPEPVPDLAGAADV